MGLLLHDASEFRPAAQTSAALFSFEEMLAPADEARILAMRADGTRALANGPSMRAWLDVAATPSSVFALLAAQPRLLARAQQLINAPVRAASLWIWVGSTGAATPALPASAGVTAVVVLSGTVHEEHTLLASGDVRWNGSDETISLATEGGLAMVCAVTYEACARHAALQPAAEGSLWPSAYVMAG